MSIPRKIEIEKEIERLMKLGLKNEIMQINKREITKEELEKVEIMITSIVKILEEIEWELGCLRVKIIIGRIKDNLDEFEIKMLKTETENEIALKQTEKNSTRNKRNGI